MKLCDILRLQHTMRWTIVPTTRTQSVAEHSFNVAIIAGRIARYYPISVNLADIRERALMHDAAEAVLGDIPTPTKSKMRDLGFDPHHLDLQVSGNVDRKPCYVEAIIKAADILDGIHFLTNFGAGKRAEAVLKQLHSAYDRMVENAGLSLPEGMKQDHILCSKASLALSTARDDVLNEDWTE